MIPISLFDSNVLFENDAFPTDEQLKPYTPFEKNIFSDTERLLHRLTDNPTPPLPDILLLWMDNIQNVLTI